MSNRMAAVLALGLIAGCEREPPATEQEFWLEIADDWCRCARRDLPGEVPPDEAEECPESVAGAVLFFSSDDHCVYDPRDAMDCVEITRHAEVTCEPPGGAVFYDGVALEDIDACHAAWLCAGPTPSTP